MFTAYRAFTLTIGPIRVCIFVSNGHSKQEQSQDDAFTIDLVQDHPPASTTHSKKMSLLQPPKLVLDDFIHTILSRTPAELHPFFESFRTLYTRKCVMLSVS